MSFDLQNRQRRLFVGGFAAVVLLVALVMLFRQFNFFRRPPPPKMTWYYDLKTGQLFAESPNLVTPIPAPSMPELIPAGKRPVDYFSGVLAYVYACPSCDEKGRVIAYLETYTVEAYQKLDALARFPPDEPVPPEIQAFQKGEAGVLVKRTQDDKWVERNSAEGQQLIREAVREACPTKPNAPRCFPQQ
ncbi:MAG: hypothetical protein PCFJNLEI_02097 [Verrucomicrobiae bacterium]|nr:hypothetical protein [Verrucomicrobiae bacterium]